MDVLTYFALAIGFIICLGSAGITGIVFTLLIECFKKGDTFDFKLVVGCMLMLCIILTTAFTLMMIQVCKSYV